MMKHRKQQRPPANRGRTHAERLAERSTSQMGSLQQLGDTPGNLSEICEQYLGISGSLCSCDMAATALSIAGKDVCSYQPFAAACGEKYAQMCQQQPPPNQQPPGQGQNAGGNTLAYVMGAVAIGGGAAYLLNRD